MIQRETRLRVADNSGAEEVLVFGIMKHTSFRNVKPGQVVLATVKKAKPHGNVKKGDKVKVVVVRSRRPIRRKDGTEVSFSDNACVVVKDKEPVATRVFGTVARELKEAGFNKIVSLADELV